MRKQTIALAAALSLLAASSLVLARDEKADKAKEEKELKAKRSAVKKHLQEVAAADAGEDELELNKAIGLLAEIRMAESKDAAEALLRIAESCKHENVFAAAKAELARFAREEPLKFLFGLVKPKDPKELKKIPWQRRVLAVESFGVNEGPIATDAIVAALEDQDVLVLNPAIVAAGKKRDKRVIPLLVSLVGRFEKTGGWEYHRTRQSLVDLTGQDFFTHEKWKQWWDANKEGFDFDRKGEAKEAKTQERVREKKPTFFGTEIKSNRLLFIIDVSGSMKATDPPDDPLNPEVVKKMQEEDPKPELQRIERARKELVHAIENLDKTQRFDILPFSDGNRVWKEDLVEATDANKKEALDLVKNLKEGGGTYTDDALKRAFAMREVDTFYFLSDGAPQKKIGNPGKQNLDFQRELIATCIEMIKRETRFRKITINSFGLCGLGAWHKKWGPRSPLMTLEPDEIAPLREFMQKVAELTGGEFKSI